MTTDQKEDGAGKVAPTEKELIFALHERMTALCNRLPRNGTNEPNVLLLFEPTDKGDEIWVTIVQPLSGHNAHDAGAEAKRIDALTFLAGGLRCAGISAREDNVLPPELKILASADKNYQVVTVALPVKEKTVEKLDNVLSDHIIGKSVKILKEARREITQHANDAPFLDRDALFERAFAVVGLQERKNILTAG